MPRSGLARILPLLLALAWPDAVQASECTDAGVADPFFCLAVLVEYEPGVLDRTELLAAWPGTSIEVDIPELQILEVRTPSEAIRDDMLARARSIRGVKAVGLNREFLSPECRQRGILFDELGAPDLIRSQPALEAIRAGEAVADGSGVLVAVIDSGADLSHPAIAPHLAAGGTDLVDGDAEPSDDANGIDDDLDGETDLGHGHGSVVASLIGAVAPGARVLVIRALDDECHASELKIAKALVVAADAGAQVINLSITLRDRGSFVPKAIQYAGDRGSLIVVAGGNTGESPLEWPAAESAAIGVAATDDAGVKWEFSSYDSAIDLVAPGVALLGAFPGGLYARASGTSFASALVSGSLALALSANPCADVRDVRRRLEAAARPVDDLPGNAPFRGKLGSGLVDAAGGLAPGAALGPADGLTLVKLASGGIQHAWRAGPAALGYRVNSVSRKDELPAATGNPLLCPGCPAPSLERACDAAPGGLPSCEDASSPGSPHSALFFKVVALCEGVEGPP